jgi:hypothetical protein
MGITSQTLQKHLPDPSGSEKQWHGLVRIEFIPTGMLKQKWLLLSTLATPKVLQYHSRIRYWTLCSHGRGRHSQLFQNSDKMWLSFYPTFIENNQILIQIRVLALIFDAAHIEIESPNITQNLCLSISNYSKFYAITSAHKILWMDS